MLFFHIWIVKIVSAVIVLLWWAKERKKKRKKKKSEKRQFIHFSDLTLCTLAMLSSKVNGPVSHETTQ